MPAATSPSSPGRVVAIGDLHADLDNAQRTLQLAGLTDETGRWTGGDTVFVQTGDTTDRGPDSKAVIELLIRLQAEAEAAGGVVHPLLGNHEVMNLMGDLRYVSAGDVADFGSPEARAAAFSASGNLGSWLRQLDVAVQVGDTVFVHGGIRPRWAKQGVAGLSRQTRAALRGQAPPAILGEDGPLWYRGYFQNSEAVACAEAKQALQTLGARRMVMGHTTQRSGKVAVRCDGAIIGIDVGISDHYGGHLGALEIRAGDAWVLTPQGPLDIADP